METIVLSGSEQIARFRLITLRTALKLELLGMKHSRGSVYALIKKEFGLKGSKQKVYDQFNEFIESTKTI
jgi:hypothetical protein